MIRNVDKLTAETDDDIRADLLQCRNAWLREYSLRHYLPRKIATLVTVTTRNFAYRF